MDEKAYEAVRSGLTEEEAARRLSSEGRNELQEARSKTPVETFLAQLQDPLIYVLLGAAVISFLLRELADAAIICVVVFVNAFVGMVQVGKAKKALDALKKLTSPHAIVVRDGVKREIPASELVVGDMVCLEAGCQVPADMRLIRASNLKIEESALTGENLPVEKTADMSPEMSAAESEETPLGDRYNMAFMTTIVTCGHGAVSYKHQTLPTNSRV